MTKSEFERRVRELLRRASSKPKPRPKPKTRRIRVKEHWRKLPKR